jgi:hypothetical protein
MAERPIFVPSFDALNLIHEVYVSLPWAPGFAKSQKEKNVRALHTAGKNAGLFPLLEVSSKSSGKVGQHLSAFHLKVASSHHGLIPLESAFQGSKVFEHAGPFKDLYESNAQAAKRDPRLRNSGRITGFEFEGSRFPTEPKTAFYDWLYIKSLYPHREWCARLNVFAGFTDIEFNPKRSIACQARSCALFLALCRRNLIDKAVESAAEFVQLLVAHEYSPAIREAGQNEMSFAARAGVT